MGKGGTVFAVGDPFNFKNVPLLDAGDGWDFLAPDGLGCWDASTLVFEVQSEDGVWQIVEPLHVHPRVGSVAFARCYRDRFVRVSGVCHPTAFVGWGASWRLEVDLSTATAPVLSSAEDASKMTIHDVCAVVDGVVAPPMDRALALLPFGGGAYTGFGRLNQMQTGVRILFDDEGVTFEPR